MRGAASPAIVMPAHNAAATIERALDCLAAQDYGAPHDLIVVDDGSSDGTAEIVRRHPHAVRLIQQPRAGPGSARNRGVAETDAEAIAFIDADVFAEPGWLSAGVAALAGADLAQGFVRPDTSVPLGPFDRTLWIDHETALYQSASLFVRRATFERIGGFADWIDPGSDERGHFGEDVDLAWRAIRAGARIRFADDARAHHAVFRRSAAGYVAERARLAYFPRLVRRVPELRTRLLRAGLFLAPRTAALDLALVAVAIAALAGSLWPLAALVPYSVLNLRQALRWARRAPIVAVVTLVADLAGLVALLRGSIAARSLVL